MHSNISEIEKEKQAKLGTPLDQEVEAGLQAFFGGQDLDGLAKETKALVRRRGVSSAMGLLRMVLGYSILDYSLGLLGVWCTVVGLGHLSKSALRHRLGHCREWLGRLVLLALLQQQLVLPKGKRVRVKLVDATVITQPGSKGVDWRMHLGFNLGGMCLDAIELTDGKGAEQLGRFPFQPGEICIADRAYALAKSLGHLLVQGAWLVIRTGWNRLAMETEAGERFDLIAWLHQQHLQPSGAPREVSVWVNTPQGRFELRLVAQALPEAAVAKARRKVREDAHKNHHTADERSLYAAGFILVLTNLPQTEWPMLLVLQLYRFRWQVELAFKRLKSLIHFDELRCKDPDLVQVYLLGKLLGVLFMERIQLQLFDCYPEPFFSTERPLSFWRLTSLLWQELCLFLRGPLFIDKILAHFPLLCRYLCDDPRKRPQQAAVARHLLNQLALDR
jgi:hypothetical protein